MASIAAAAPINVLTLNQGSSSLKFGLYAALPTSVVELTSGEIDGQPGDDGVFDRIKEGLGERRPAAIGHRVVHGGANLFDPIVIDADVARQLEQAAVFAPLHTPAALKLLNTAQAEYPSVPHVACFDTAFHATMPDVASVLPVPKALRLEGIRRYGFHGLSCASIVHQLGSRLPERLIIAHLGSGASVTAVRAGTSIDTSMGLTPSGGIVMATRAGDIDPGLILYLMRERAMDDVAVEQLIDRRSGLAGISGLSGDLQALRKVTPTDADADLAVRMFCRSVSKAIAGMIAALGGIDMIVFTGGIGENDAATRDAVCADLAWAGVPSGKLVQFPEGVRVLAMTSEEGRQIARETISALAA
jgi:acetate kinase